MILNRLRSFFNAPVLDALREKGENKQQPFRESKQSQVDLMLKYRQMLHHGIPLPKFDEVGFSVFSESDEDGILHYIFSLAGTANKRLVDIGSASISGSNTANLLINHGWTGLLIEGDEKKVQTARQFYQNSLETRNFPPKVINTWITRENINQLLAGNSIEGEIDLLSIDIDGVDYWLWKALDAVSPQVVVLEYQCIWGPDKAVTVPYSADFKGGFVDRYGVYSGASLAAFVKLGREKGYRLVGCQRYGYNAFFIRDDVGADIFPEIPAAECFRHPFTRWAQAELLPKVKDREWVEV